MTSNDVADGANHAPRMPQEVRERPIPWVPGELLVGVNIFDGESNAQSQVDALRRIVRDVLGDIEVEEPLGKQPALATPILEGQQRLLFEPFTLRSREPRLVKQAVEILNSSDGRRRLDGAGLPLIAATPNWFSCAAQDCSGGSPASQPVPVVPYGSRVRYAPLSGALDLAAAAEHSAWAKTGSGPDGVHIAVLDTAPTRRDLNGARQRYPQNAHLQDLLGRLLSPIGSLRQPDFEQARKSALVGLDQIGFHPVEPPEPYDVRDHGLFVGGVALATAPWVRIRLIRVLNDHGVGSFRSLLIALIALMQSKRTGEPLVINLSLGMLPAHEQLADIWLGLPIEGLPGCPEDSTLQFLPGGPVSRERLQTLVEQNDPAVSGLLDDLEAPLRSLMGVLRAHNCLVVAAAGNDSVFRGATRVPRWDPRVPARYDDVLGVAADTVQPALPASYSNRGELPSDPVRDAVATLGGNLAPDGVSPMGGVIGVYASKQFPSLPPSKVAEPNETGWAEWSGTSFATPIMAGIASNFWAAYPASASQTLAAINAAVRFGSPVIADLGVPPVPLRFSWLQ
jgi:hypothetical protein